MITKDFLLSALLRKNYFPLQKEAKEELPPGFSSKALTSAASEEIRDISLSRRRKRDGFDSVQYTSTRFNNVPRLLALPHPKPYVDAVFVVHENWDSFNHICSNENSIVRPKKHNDGRIIIMDYEDATKKRERHYEAAFGQRYMVHTDISSCFPSLYTHALPWALVGFDFAKRNRGGNWWFNKLDQKMRLCSRNETAGVPIGPALSNIACEIILERIDVELREKYLFHRFIDDYTAYCKDDEQAESFIRDLNSLLWKYKFNLSIRKTRIEKLPQAINDEWIGRIREIIPSESPVSPSKVADVIDAALRLLQDNPDASILKYAAKSLVGKLNDASALEFTNSLLGLSYHYPVLVPVLHQPLRRLYEVGKCDYEKQFVTLLADAARDGRSDTACWLLYFLKVFHDDVPSDVADLLVKWGDSMTLTLLAEFGAHTSKVIRFAEELCRDPYNYELDNYWILLYQLFLQDMIVNPQNDESFAVLKNHGVSFLQV